MKRKVLQGWVTSDQLTEGDIIVFTISKNEIELQATYRFEMQIKELMKVGKPIKNSLIISVTGYDNDNRELYQIPEFTEYFRKLFFDIPCFFYFIDIKSFSFSILVNAIFKSLDEVSKADKAILDYANSVGDIDYKITISYYATHHKELTS